MKTHFVTIAVDLQKSPAQLQQAILAELRNMGEPLRWAIVAVEGDRAQVEAVVTTVSDFPIPLIGITTV